MATITPQLLPDPASDTLRVLWETLTQSDTATSVQYGPWSDRSVQVVGNFGSGGTIVLQGSNDGGTTWATLEQPDGTAVSFTATGMAIVATLAHRVRPSVTAGTGVDVDVYLFGRSGKR